MDSYLKMNKVNSLKVNYMKINKTFFLTEEKGNDRIYVTITSGIVSTVSVQNLHILTEFVSFTF